MTEAIDPTELRGLFEAIFARYGYDLRAYAPASIERRVRAALATANVPTVAELQTRLLADPSYFSEVLRSLTVRVSEMFRDPMFYATFREQIVPRLRTYPLLRIWHSGCATGEEAYTTAILLTEEGLYDRAQIYATDLSEEAIGIAKQGMYSVERLEKFAQNYRQAGGPLDLERYCTVAYDRIAIRSHLKRNILFFHHDLVSDQAFGEMHVVFCRNVLIYFDAALKAHVLQKLAQSLRPGGFLCLGASEQLPRDTAAFTSFAPAARIYQHAG